MAQGISPNNLNKISQVYLSQISEHHKKDADGNTIPHEDENIDEAKVDMKNYLDKKAKMLTKKREAQSDAAKNNPHFDSTQPSPSGRNKYEEVVHEKKEMIKVKLKDPSKIKVKVTDIGPGGKEYVLSLIHI